MQSLYRYWWYLIPAFICYLLLQGTVTYAQEYQLRLGDTLVVTVIDNPEFGGTVTVTPDGSILLPVVGRCQVVGKTAMEVASLLRTGYAQRLLEPEVYVSVSAMSATHVYALGAVKNPGAYALQGKMGTLELLLAANGLAQPPDDCRATVLRKATNERIALLLSDLLAGRQDANMPLADGDVLFIEPLPKLAVYVTGDVRAPGLYELPDGVTVSQALVSAQGVQGDATQKRVVILRGKDTIIVDAGVDSRGATDADMPIHKGDVLRVESAVITVNIAGEVAQPASYTVKRDLTVTELLALAGGPTGAARLAAVTLAHSDGTQQILDLQSDLRRGDAYRLQPGDLLTVPAALMSVHVDGEVKLPGTYRFRPSMRMADVIKLAGGAKENAALGGIYITRLNGTLETLDASQPAGEDSDEILLHEGDRIVVPTISTRVTVAGNVRLPGFYPLDEHMPYTVSEAVFRAGGLAERSADKRITVMRNVDGAATKYTINMRKALSSGDPQDDLMLQPGDTVYVPKSSERPPVFSSVLTALSIISLLRGVF